MGEAFWQVHEADVLLLGGTAIQQLSQILSLISYPVRSSDIELFHFGWSGNLSGVHSR